MALAQGTGGFGTRDGIGTAAGSLKGVGVPVKLLHEAEGHICTVELKTGEIYRGDLEEAEDNWNVQLTKVTATARDGKVSHMEHIFIRGSRIRFVIVPDMLKNAPMFKRMSSKLKSTALGAGTAAAGGRGRGRGRF
eukprot:scaffold5.g746.t1